MKTVIFDTEREIIVNGLKSYIGNRGLNENVVYADMSQRLGKECLVLESNKTFWRRELGINGDSNKKKKLSWQMIVKCLPVELKRSVFAEIIADCDLYGDSDGGNVHEAQEQVITQRARSDKAFLGYMVTGSQRSCQNALRETMAMATAVETKIHSLANILH